MHLAIFHPFHTFDSLMPSIYAACLTGPHYNIACLIIGWRVSAPPSYMPPGIPVTLDPCKFGPRQTKTNTNPDPNQYRRRCPDPNARIQKFIHYMAVVRMIKYDDWSILPVIFSGEELKGVRSDRLPHLPNCLSLRVHSTTHHTQKHTSNRFIQKLKTQ